MQLKVNKLGPIRDSEVDFSSDITVIFGKSNTGKSYILKALYSNLSFLDESNYIILANMISSDIYSSIAKDREKVYGKEIEIPINLKEYVEKFIQTLSKRVISDFDVTFSLLSDILSKVEKQSKNITINNISYDSNGNICPTASYKLLLSYSEGYIKAKIERHGKIDDELLCNTSLSGFITGRILNFVSQYIIPQVMSEVGGSICTKSESVCINSVRFLSYGRNTILHLINESPSLLSYPPLSPMYPTLSLLYFIFPPLILRSTYYWIINGINTLKGPIDKEKEIEEIKRIFDIFNIKISYQEERIKINDYELPQTSASYVEIAALYLSTIDGRGGLLLIEEPESQLDVYKQISIAILLYNLSKKFKIVLTTHSENVLLTLAMLSYYSKLGDKVKEIFSKYGNPDVRDVKISFYFVDDKEGKVKSLSDREILENDKIFAEINKDLFSINAKLDELCGEKCK